MNKYRSIIAIRCLAFVVTTALMGATETGAADNSTDYLTHVKPLLREKCYRCHGALEQEAGLRLDTVGLMLQGGHSGAAITPGDGAGGLLVERISTPDVSDRMPPEHEGEPLSREQIAAIQDWISEGAAAPNAEEAEGDPKNHWAYQSIVRPDVPIVGKRSRSKNPIDLFIADMYRTQGLRPVGEASRLVLLRRVYLDLIGLPPSAEEIEQCKRDRSPDWYERTVDRLLDDPRHGERWARHWMDIWRYSDWSGLNGQLRNSQKHIWHWRDWIVESLNDDLPYDEMIRLMLAADESHPKDPDKLRATGFLARNYVLFNRDQWMDATVEHVSKGFLGITMNCAKCHEHKFDPIEHADYYRMRAFFEPYHARLDVVPGEADLEKDGIPRVYDGLLDKPTYRYVRGLESRPDKSDVMRPGLPEILGFSDVNIEAVELPVEAWQPARNPWVLDAHLATARSNVKSAALEVQRLQKATANGPIPEEAADDTKDEAPVTQESAASALAIAQAEFRSVERRAEAMRAGWNNASENELRNLTDAAVLSERDVALAKAKHALVEAEASLTNAGAKNGESIPDKITDQLRSAKADLRKAEVAVAAPVLAKDTYTPLEGAKWTPTRFEFSLEDDPTVTFQPRSTGRRTALAEWITNPRNPLTSRVAANHIWTRHFGKPLVSSVFDFGRNGSHPTHPALLDWLAAELIESGWSMKHMHRLMVTSATYRMRSSGADRRANQRDDPDNQYWWRRESIRAESQVVRDAILALSGSLDQTMGGASVPTEAQAKSTRRSLYFFHSALERDVFLTTFDEATVNECYRRAESIVPQQALALSNSSLVYDASEEIASRISSSTKSEKAFIREAFKTVLCTKADRTEVRVSREALAEWRALPNGSEKSARTHLIWALINHNDFVTIR
jgi:hypothetical protein